MQVSQRHRLGHRLGARSVGAKRSQSGRTLDAFGAGLVLGYKWAFDPGPFIDLNGGAGWGYMLASGAEDLEGRGISVFPFVNLNVGWAF